MSKRNSQAAKAQRRAERQERHDRAAAAYVESRPRIPQVLDVELIRTYDHDDGEYEWWSAEWGLHNNSVGTEDSNENLQELVDSILDDARKWTDRHDLTIEWTCSGDAPPGKTVQDMVTEAGITLPTAPFPK